MATNIAFVWMDSIIAKQFVRFNFKMDVIIAVNSIPTTVIYDPFSANYVMPDDINPDTVFRD